MQPSKEHLLLLRGRWLSFDLKLERQHPVVAPWELDVDRKGAIVLSNMAVK